MKKYFVLIMALTVFLSCRKDEIADADFCEDGLFDVNLRVQMGDDDTESKVSARGLALSWDSGDAIGIFHGGSSVNSKFTLASGADAKSASFSGKLYAGSGYLYAYYPYEDGVNDRTKWYVTLEGQVCDGDFSENGVSSNYRKYAFMTATLSNVTISSSWPENKTLSFKPKTGLVQFDLSSSLAESIVVDNVSLSSDEEKLFYDPVCISIGGTSTRQAKNVIGVDINTESGHELILPSGDGSIHKYVQLVVSPTSFNANDINVIVSGSVKGRRVKYVLAKHVTVSNNFATGKRTRIQVPITDSTPATFASEIGISQKGTSLVVPEFSKSKGFVPDITVWGDGSREIYYGGAKHVYSDSGVHNASVSCWSKVTLVTFDNLENITAIDFSKF